MERDQQTGAVKEPPTPGEPEFEYQRPFGWIVYRVNGGKTEFLQSDGTWRRDGFSSHAKRKVMEELLTKADRQVSRGE